jgi:putative protease
MGEYVGIIQGVINNRAYRYNGNVELHNGDGLCYIDKEGNFHGFRINRVEGRTLHTATPQSIEKGTAIYRNSDHDFDNALQRPTAQRHIEVEITLTEQPEGFALTISDGKTHITHRCNAEKSLSRTPQAERQRQELGKLGNTAYRANRIDIALSQDYFIPPSLLSTWRREAIEWFERARRLAYRPDRRKKPQGNPQWLTTQVDYHANIANPKAEHFYRSHGVESTAPAFELSQPRDGELMRTRHCIRHFLGACLKTPQGKNLVAPLTLRQDNINLSLHFDCARCEMVIKKF